MRVYTISTKSYEPFVKNIESELNKIKDVKFFCKYIDELPANYRNTSFKLKYIYQDIILDPENQDTQVLFIDCTSLFDSSMYDAFLESINKDLDIMIAKEYRSNKKINIGAMLIKCNQKVAKFFQNMIYHIDEYGVWDQAIFQKHIYKKNLNWDFFDRQIARVMSSRDDRHIMEKLIQQKSFIYKFIRRPQKLEVDIVYSTLLKNIS